VGYSADAEIILDARENVLRIPTQALFGSNKVLVLQDGVLRERELGLGLANWQHTEITRGLQAGDQVVVSLEKEGVKAGARAVAK
jgi:HlyD family secretion protein